MDRTDLFNKIYEKTNLNPHSLSHHKKVLIERGEFLSGQIERVRQWHKERNTDPIGCPEIGILTNEIIENDIQISIIEDELSRLESEKTKENTKTGGSGKSAKNRVLAFNNGGSDIENISDAMEKIEMILYKINDLIFVDSTPKQWKQLLKGSILEKPIVIKDTITMEDFKYFIDSSKKEPAQIFGSGLYTAFEDNKAFFWNENLLTRTKISNYYKRNEKQREAAGIITKINDILSTLI